ncbi:MAG: 30S ribosomal protein S20 [Candidatus Acidiferrales bacterium]
MPQGTPVKQKKRSKSVFKNMRQTEHRTDVNRANRTRVRTAIRQFRASLATGDVAKTEKLVSQTFSELDRAVKNHSLPRNTANRHKSRLTIALNRLRQPKKS